MATFMVIEAKEYSNRNDLESAVKSLLGHDIITNREGGHTIEGTRAELVKYQLSDMDEVFGVKVVITDDPTPEKLKEKKLKIKKELLRKRNA